MIRLKKHAQVDTSRSDCEKEIRLVEAEKRANVLVQTAEWLHTVMAQRDAVNHWQESVNLLFYPGGKP